MEVELLLTAFSNNSNSIENIEAEKKFTQKILPSLESFTSFVDTHEIFDTNHHKKIHSMHKFIKAYHEKLDAPFHFLFCKN